MSASSTRKCEIVQQLKYLPGYPDNWTQTLKQNLENNPNIKSWAYIIHDKDVDEEGNIVEPHVHIVLEFYESVKYSTAGGYVGVPAQYVAKIRQQYKSGRRWLADIGGALSYLTHRNKPDGYQYDDAEVVAKPGYDWLAVRTKSEERQKKRKSLQAILDGIDTGEIRRYNVFDYMSQSLYIEYKNDIEKAFAHREGRMKNSVNNREINVMYICGASSSGKTALAKKYCEDKDLSYCVSASSRDPLQDYEGQDALILDDLRPETFPLADLLKLLDNHTMSSASARYHDRWVDAKLIIITTVLEIEDFFRRIGCRDEPIRQLKRRCRIMIRLTSEKMELYSYRESSGEYMQIACDKNPITERYAADQRDVSEDDLKAICKDFGLEYSPEGLPSDYVLDDCPFA